MLRRDLIDLVNEGNAWAFMGSGVSVDSGYPTWVGLIEGALRALDEKSADRIRADGRFMKAQGDKNYPRAFSRMQAIVGDRPKTEGLVKAQLSERPVGRLVGQLVRWPFAGYITVNYDDLIERALESAGEAGWLAVGNTDDEVKKVSGDVPRVVWHVHGAVKLDGKSRLVLAEEDYDDLYLRDSWVMRTLRGLLQHRRVVFFGFGFQDQEVVRLIKSVGMMCHPARPAFAFLSGVSGSENIAKREELLERYNVDVVPYDVVDTSHERLCGLVDTYGALVLRRHLRFGQPKRQCPSYDPQTTALLFYNRLVLSGEARLSGELVGQLIRAQLLSIVNYRTDERIGQLVEELGERVRLIRGEEVGASSQAEEMVVTHLKALVEAGLAMTSAGFGLDSRVAITEKGRDLIGAQAAQAALIAEQFSLSLAQRARALLADDPQSAERVAGVAEAFLKDCIERRALGVARAWRSARVDFRQYHTTALLQALPDFAQGVGSLDEARALLRLIGDILTEPDGAEALFLGVALQAQFGINLLGYDPKVLEERIGQASKTLFLIDSTTLIPYLARSAVGNETAAELVSRLGRIGASVAATDLLAVEVAEHARWALERVGPDATPASDKLLAYATGKLGFRRNLFLDGYLAEVADGKSTRNFGAYLDAVCGSARGHTGADEVFAEALQAGGIRCARFDEWEGFSQDLLDERRRLEEEITTRRHVSGTFRHERQVRAEAEAVIAIRCMRDGAFRWDGSKLEDAYFVSNTGIIDDLAGVGLPVTMRPQSVLQWIGTLTGCTPEELVCLTNGLLWELCESGADFVDSKRIERVFYALVHAAREKLDEERATHKVLIAQRYGEDGDTAFAAARDIDVPVVLRSYFAQKAIALEEQVQIEREAREAAEKRATLREQDVRFLGRAKQKQEERARRTRKRQRARLSAPAKQKRRKG
jgi:hypothetical protein